MRYKGLTSIYFLLIPVILGLSLLGVLFLKAKTSAPAGDLGRVSTQSDPRSATASVETDLGVASYEEDQQGEITRAAVGSELDSYTNSQLGFKISYPVGWSVGNYSLNIGTLQKVATKGSAVVFLEQSPNAADKNELLSAYLKSPITVILFNQPITKFKELTSGGASVVVDGRQSIKKINDKSGRQNIFVPNGDTSTFEIIFSPQYGGGDELFGKVLKSFLII